MSATFGFLPWLRQGMINKMSSTLSPSGRAQVDISVNLSGSVTPIQKSAQLIGPGDILGVHSEAIIRVDPKEGSFDFEANYLPYIEFYEEDLPWRYTAMVNPSDGKLCPWLALIALKDNEYTTQAGTKEELPAVLKITAAKNDVFHPYQDHWAWAHVHINKPRGNSSTYGGNFKQDIKENPDLAVSRLICPRRLEANTQYTAFLIPAFEAGRLAGLGLEVTNSTTTKMSWEGSVLDFPIYYQWRFGTASLGDFETLVRELKPTVTNGDLGGTKMDISNAGMNLSSLYNSSTTLPKSTLMEGAVMPPAYNQGVLNNASSIDAFTVALKNNLNLPSLMKEPSFASGSTPNPFDASLPNLQNDDPIILPHIYGMFHSGVTSVNSSSPDWVQELNLNPKYRAAAGIGAQVVRERQEELMETAWKQVKDVLDANDKISKAVLAMNVSAAIYDKHVIGGVFRATATADEKLNNIINIAAAGMKKIPGITTTSTSAATAYKTASSSKLTVGSVDASFRKISRSRSSFINKISQSSSSKINKELVSKINISDDFTACVSSTKVKPVATSTASYITTGGTSASSAFSGALTYSANGIVNVYNNQKYNLDRTLKFYDQLEAPFIATKPSLTTGSNFVTNTYQALNPEIAITERVKKMIKLQIPNGTISTVSELKTIMAYPVFDEPTFDDLIKISPEYLLPGIDKYPNNTITLLQTNQRFIESYMAGLNHEFARELLWREYPTDQRGSYFRRFWDVNDTIDLNTTDYLYDINEMHLWGNNGLGDNHTSGRHGNSSNIVLMIKGDLFKKFPNALVYLQKAQIDTSTNKRILTPNSIKFPLFKASLQPNITLLGFDISKQNALNESGTGWFIVFRERPGQLRLGLDEYIANQTLPTISNSNTSWSWNDLNWGHMGANAKTVRIDAFTGSAPVHNGITWGKNAAEMAWVLYQNPVMVAVHADDMIVS